MTQSYLRSAKVTPTLAAARIPIQSHLAGRIAVLQRPLIHGEGIVVGGRGRVFRRQAVVGRQDGAPRGARQVGRNDTMRAAGAHEEAAAVVQNDEARGISTR